MTSTRLVERASDQIAEQEQLTYWPALSVDEKAFVVSYIENSYSANMAAEALGWGKNRCYAMLRDKNIRAAIKEVQDSLGEIDFLNEKWVKSQLLRLMPMVMGDEPVPVVTNTGEQTEARIFKPDIAMRVVEYVAPRKTGLTLNQVNINNDSGEGRLSKLAERLVALQANVRSSNTIDVTPEED